MRHGYRLVLTLIVATYGLALVPGGRWLPAALLFLQSATVWQALRVSRARPLIRTASAAVVTLAVVAATATLLAPGTALTGPTFLAAGGLYLVAPLSIVRDIGVRRRR